MNVTYRILVLILITVATWSPAGVQAQRKSDENKNASARVLEADALLIDAAKARMLNDAKEEEALLRKAIQVHPESGAAHFYLARLSLAQRNMESAEKHIREAVRLDPANKWNQNQLGEVLGQQNRFEEAAEVFEQLGNTEKNNQDYLFKAALLYQRSGKNQRALELIDQLLVRTADNPEIHTQKHQMLLKMDDLKGALSVAEQLIRQNPREPRFYGNLASIYDSNNEPAKALEVFQRALEQFPNDPAIQVSLAEHYRQKNDTANYKHYIRQAILNQNFDDETQAGILQAYLQELSADTGMRDESIDITRQLIEQHPENAKLRGLYGDVLRMNDQIDQAAEQYKKAVAIEPSLFSIWQGLLFIYTAPKDADSLITYSEKAMRYFPNQAMVHYLHGIGHFNKRALTNAVRSINRAVELQPEDNIELMSQMYATLGDIFNELKEYSRSDSSYEQALRLDPENPTVLNNYAYYLSVRGQRLDDAEKMSARSLELRPGEATFLDTYGWILYKQGNYKKAKEFIEDAIEASPDADGTLWDHLGDIEYRLGNQDKALEHWKKAREKGTDNQHIDRKIKDGKLYE